MRGYAILPKNVMMAEKVTMNRIQTSFLQKKSLCRGSVLSSTGTLVAKESITFVNYELIQGFHLHVFSVELVLRKWKKHCQIASTASATYNILVRNTRFPHYASWVIDARTLPSSVTVPIAVSGVEASSPETDGITFAGVVTGCCAASGEGYSESLLI